MYPETRGERLAFVFIELPRLGVPHPFVLWGDPERSGRGGKSGEGKSGRNPESGESGESGDRRDIPHFSALRFRMVVSVTLRASAELLRWVPRPDRAQPPSEDMRTTNRLRFPLPISFSVFLFVVATARLGLG